MSYDVNPISAVKIMGVLNVTPDSFSDGGKYLAVDQALLRASQMLSEGVDIIDVGGESSRPYATPLSQEDELARVIPVIQQLSSMTTLPISIDTYKPAVMLNACEAGAKMINDIRALSEPGAMIAAKACGVPVVLMHMQNKPATMQVSPVYEDVVYEVNAFFEARIQACMQAGIPRAHLILDPGFGFGKTVQHNVQLLKKLSQFKEKWQLPLLVGLSKKSMIGDLLGLPVAARQPASLALAVYAALKGADIIRTHDVLATRQAVMMVKAVEANQ